MEAMSNTVAIIHMNAWNMANVTEELNLYFNFNLKWILNFVIEKLLSIFRT